MSGGNDAAHRIEEEERHAVGEAQQQGQSRLRRHQGVAGGHGLVIAARAHARIAGADKAHFITVHLARRDDPRSVKPQSLSKETAILRDVRGAVADVERHVQRGKRRL